MCLYCAKRGIEISKQDIHSFCRENLAKYKVPRYIEFCDSIPKNQLGKILRRELKSEVNLTDLVPVS